MVAVCVLGTTGQRRGQTPSARSPGATQGGARGQRRPVQVGTVASPRRFPPPGWPSVALTD